MAFDATDPPFKLFSKLGPFRSARTTNIEPGSRMSLANNSDKEYVNYKLSEIWFNIMQLGEHRGAFPYCLVYKSIHR